MKGLQLNILTVKSYILSLYKVQRYILFIGNNVCTTLLNSKSKVNILDVCKYVNHCKNRYIALMSYLFNFIYSLNKFSLLCRSLRLMSTTTKQYFKNIQNF